MLSLPAYRIGSCLYSGPDSEVYRALREADGLSVVLKWPRRQYADSPHLARLRHEYELGRSLELKGVVRVLDLVQGERGWVLVLEDIGGLSLQQVLDTHKIDLGHVLGIALQVLAALAELHAHGLLHQAVAPANIIVNLGSGEVKLTDLGLARHAGGESDAYVQPKTADFTYLAPEQSGRTRRRSDYRSDYYALGIVLYEMLVGFPPFQSEDPLEVVHGHIAKLPVPPHPLNPRIPRAVSGIVMKLLAKNPGDRYQSRHGLESDLRRCLRQWQAQQKIEDFVPGQADYPESLQIPFKLYGREAEFRQLRDWLETSGGDHSQVFLVHGAQGVGKSELVRQFGLGLAQPGTYFISGKFNELQRDIPYSALVSGFSDLVRQLLTYPEREVCHWREQLVAALGHNAPLIVEVIPELELVLGAPTAPPGDADLGEFENRFNRSFEKFIGVFARPRHPLVIFLDNLQWADSATLNLLSRLLLESRVPHLVLLGTYRDGAVDEQSPLARLLREMSRDCQHLHVLHLQPLAQAAVVALLRDSMPGNGGEVNALATLVSRKTGGNPFFIREFLHSLYARRLLNYVPPEGVQPGHWDWELAQLEEQAITDNVAALLAGKLSKLSAETRDVLALMACIGNRCQLDTLVGLSGPESTASEVSRHLGPALQEELISASVQVSPDDSGQMSLNAVVYQFSHTRVRQAAYALLDQTRRQWSHLRVARYWQQHLSPGEREERLFELVGQWNAGCKSLLNPEERLQVTSLNLAAADKAKDSTAYAEALKYLQVALACLGDECWREHYSLSLMLHQELAEVTYLNGQVETAEAVLRQSLERARDPLDKSRFYYLLIVQYTMTARYQDALAAGREGLARLALELPRQDYEVALQGDADAIGHALQGRSLDSLLDAAELSDPTQRAVLCLLSHMVAPAFFTSLPLWAVVVAKMVNLSLRYGHRPESSFAYTSYAMVLVTVLQDYRRAHEFGWLGFNLGDRLAAPAYQCKNAYILANYITPWTQHLRWAKPVNDAGHQAGLEAGEWQFCGYILVHKALNAFYSGQPLAEVAASLAEYLQFNAKTKNRWAYDALHGLQLGLAGLLKENPTPEADNAYLQQCASYRSHQAQCLYWIVQAQAAFLAGQARRALDCVQHAEAQLHYVQGLYPSAAYHFYAGLSLAALYPEVEATRRSAHRARLLSHLGQLQRWGRQCPDNFLHLALLLEAEWLRVQEQEFDALEHYQRGLDLAETNGFIQDLALGHELAARFWLNQHKTTYAASHLQAAAQAYRQWGASGHLRQLRQQYPGLLNPPPPADRADDPGQLDPLDLNSVLKASQAIAGEIKLDRLLATLMRIAVENAGAQKGCLLLMQDGELSLAARSSVESVEPAAEDAPPLDPEQTLPMAIAHYAAKTLQPVVLANAARDGAYTQDPYVRRHRLKSLLCSPITQQGRLLGLLYLENNLISGAFSTDRLQVLSLLSAQAAISIENALLYRNLEQKVAERTAELAAAGREIHALNQRLHRENQRMGAELDLTRQLQHMILPPAQELERIPQLDIAGFMEPADEVGGDYYDVLYYHDHVIIGMGDVTGHGLESGMLMLMVQTALRTLAVAGVCDPQQCLHIINRTLYDNVRRMDSAKSMTLVVLDYQDGQVRLSGQHEEVLLVRGNGEIECIDTLELGLFLGMTPDISQHTGLRRFRLRPGDGVVLYSDGITEAENHHHEAYGLERLCAAVRRHWHQPAVQIRQELTLDLIRFCAQEAFEDDLTLLVIKQN